MCPCIYKCVSYYEIFALLAFSSSWQETNHSKSNLKSLILLWLKRSKNISQDSQAEGEKVSIFLKRPWELAFPQIFRYNRDFPEIFFFFSPANTLSRNYIVFAGNFTLWNVQLFIRKPAQKVLFVHFNVTEYIPDLHRQLWMS